jgi:hypothetical protein
MAERPWVSAAVSSVRFPPAYDRICRDPFGSCPMSGHLEKTRHLLLEAVVALR